MNRALLADLQRRRTYPSITVLLNTEPGRLFGPEEASAARRLAAHADRRLTGDAPDSLRAELVARLERLITQQVGERSAHALALCVSAEHESAVRLGRRVEERVVIDDTFATRDLVADLNRTALYRLVTLSDRKTRLFVGDRVRIVEERNGIWPLERSGEQGPAAWLRLVAEHLRAEQTANPLPTVLAGVERTVRSFSRSFAPAVTDGAGEVIGVLPGNHDRTSWAALHNAAWPVVSDWLRTDGRRAVEALARARSACRFAGGIDEVWTLAHEGRVETLVVEDGYAVSARVTNGRLVLVEDREAPDVVDDIVDDTIEVVLRHSGSAVIVPDGELDGHDRIAAVLRY